MIPYFIKNRIYKIFNRDQNGEQHYSHDDDKPCTNYDEAELVTSGVVDAEMHMPVLDLDFSAHLEPSSTPGHYHLYLNKEVEWEKFKKLLNCMVDCGLIEEGYASASIERGYSAVRRPGVFKKEITSIASGDLDLPF